MKMEAPKTVEDFYVFKIKNMWVYFKSQHFSFWMICGYLFFEFVKPQSIFPFIDFLPWAQILLMGALLGVFMDGSVTRTSSVANIYIVMFAILIILSVFFAKYPDYASKHFMLFFSWFIIYFLIINIVNTPERFYLFLMIYLFAAGKIAIGTSKSWIMRGFSYQGWGLMGPAGYFQNSGELAILMVMLFPLAFFLYRNLKNGAHWLERGLLLAFWICPILTVLGASSRGSQVAMMIQMVIMFRKSIFKLKPLIGVLILSAALINLLPEEQKARFTSAGDDKTSQQRLLYWEHGWEMMKEFPVLGVGFFNFVPYYESYYSYDMLYPTAQLPHNIFIQVGTDAGFLALILFILLILYCLWVPIVKAKYLRGTEQGILIGLGYGVFGFLIAGQFVTVSYYPFLWIHLGFIVALTSIFSKKGVVR